MKKEDEDGSYEVWPFIPSGQVGDWIHRLRGPLINMGTCIHLLV